MVVIPNFYRILASGKLYNFVTQCHKHLEPKVYGFYEGENHLTSLVSVVFVSIFFHNILSMPSVLSKNFVLLYRKLG
jgi:hypothetical protein